MKLLRPIPPVVTRPFSVIVLIAWVACMALLVQRSYLQASSANLATDLARYGPTATWRITTGLAVPPARHLYLNTFPTRTRQALFA